MNIADRIFSKRTSLGLSKAALAKAIGVSDVSVGKWESGINQPKGRYLNALAAELGVTVNWLLTGSDSSPERQGLVIGSWGTGKTSDILKYLKEFEAQRRNEPGQAVNIDDLLRNLAALPDAQPPQDGVAAEKAGFSNVEPAVIPQGRRVPILSYVQAGNWREICEQATAFDGNVEYVSVSVDIGPRGFGLWLRGDSMTPLFNEGDLVIIDPDEAPRPGDYVVASNGSNEATFKKYRARGEYEDGRPRFELVPLNEDHETLSTDQTPIIIIGVMVEHRSYRKRGG